LSFGFCFFCEVLMMRIASLMLVSPAAPEAF
jgi:hypothetical protein